MIVETRNGKAELPAKLGKIEKGQVFIPFHWGAHQQGGHDHMNGRAVAANELTQPAWDFISKQPIFKVRRRWQGAGEKANIKNYLDCRCQAHQGYQRKARSPFWSRARYRVAGEACIRCGAGQGRFYEPRATSGRRVRTSPQILNAD